MSSFFRSFFPDFYFFFFNIFFKEVLCMKLPYHQKKLLQECAALGGCVTGEAKLTKGYDLPAKYIIHTVGPVYSAYAKEDAKKLLISCYNKSLSLAFLNNLRKIAFPLISAGVYGYPKKEALEVAIETITQFNQDLDVTLILFDKEAYSIVCNNFSEFCI